MEEEGLAGTKKKARREGRILLFIDESGLSQQVTASLSHLGSSWTDPILQYNFNWKSLSVAFAGLTVWNFYFRIYAGTIKKEQVVDFLKALVRHLDTAVTDRVGSPARPSARLVQDYIASLQGWICTAYLLPSLRN